jgi:hypothetical protein
MVLQIELDPITEARLNAEAEVRGVAVEEYAVSLLRDSASDYPTGTGILTPEGLKRLSAELSRGSENLPVLPPEATDRESFYEDRW